MSTLYNILNGSNGVEPVFQSTYKRRLTNPCKEIHMKKKKKEWQPSNGAQEGDCTELGIIKSLYQSSVHSNETVAKFIDDTSTGIKGVKNWSRMDRIISRMIENKKKREARPVFKSMIKDLALLWECSFEEAYSKSESIESLEDALTRAKAKQKAMKTQQTVKKFGL